jgi:hypothetical protein
LLRGKTTPGDLGYALVGAALCTALFLGVNRVETGDWLTASDAPSEYLAFLWAKLQVLSFPDGAHFLATELVSNAFTVTMLGALAFGSLLGRRLFGVALLVFLAVAPYLAFFCLWSVSERGGYFIPLVPCLALSFAACKERGSAHGTSTRFALTLAALVALAAVVGGVRTPPELIGDLRSLGLLLFPPAAVLVGLATRVRFREGSWGAIALAATLAQAVGAERELHSFRCEPAIADWAVDATFAAGEDRAILITTGFGESHALLLLREDWPDPYRGTWPPREAIPNRAPAPIDIAVLPLVPLEQLADASAEHTVLVDQRVVARFSDDPLVGSSLRALRERFDFEPVSHGSFRGHRLSAR